MFRKYFISNEPTEFGSNHFPFYAWQCVTIQLKHRDVDLVIPNEKSMNRLLFYLSYRLNYKMNKNFGGMIKNQEFEEQDERDVIETIDKMNRFRFRLLRVRTKISYLAYQKKMSVVQLFLHAILKSLR